MLGRYRSIVKQRYVFAPLRGSAAPSLRRWNSNSTTSPININDVTPEADVSHREVNDEANMERINSSTVDIKARSVVEHDYMNFPWENTGKNNNETEKEDLPWETANLEGETSLYDNLKSEVIEPSRNELILAPLKKKSSPIERLTPRKKKLYVNNAPKVNLQFERDYKNLMQFKYNVSSDDFINVIEELKPTTNLITVKQLTDLSQNLDKSFRVNQIRQYINDSCPDINLNKSMSKKKMINKIISEHWNLKVTLDPTGDFVSETRIDLSNKRDLFLLLSNRGFLPQHWSLIGAQLSLGNSTKELVVRGSKNIVNFVQASWNDLLNNISTDTIDLKKINELNEKTGKILDIDLLQQECGVYFDQVSMDKNSYVLSAIKNASISNAKIELLKNTEYRYGCNKRVIRELIEQAKKEDSESIVKMNVSDESLPWYIKGENYFRYSLTKKRLSESLLSDESMMVELLSDEVQDLKVEVEEAKEKFEYNYVQTEDEFTGKTKTRFQSDNKFFKLTKEEPGKGKEDFDKVISCVDIKLLEKELVNPEFKGKTDKGKLMLDNVINVKFGKLLFNKEKGGHNNTYFNENLPEVLRNIGKLELMDKESRLFGPTGGIMNRFNKQIYVRLIPNGFWNNEFEKFIELPSIEILFELKDGKLEVNRFSSFISEYENNIEMSIPQFDIDLKFQSSYNSMLVYNKDQWILNGYKEEEFKGLEGKDNNNNNNDNDITLNKRHINMFISQIGKRQFDTRKLDGLRGMLYQFKHKPYVFEMGKDSVKYSAVKVEYVKSLELEYNGLPVSFEIRDDGEHERVEVSLLKDNVSMEEFVNQSVSLAQFLCK